MEHVRQTHQSEPWKVMLREKNAQAKVRGCALVISFSSFLRLLFQEDQRKTWMTISTPPTREEARADLKYVIRRGIPDSRRAEVDIIIAHLSFALPSSVFDLGLESGGRLVSCGPCEVQGVVHGETRSSIWSPSAEKVGPTLDSFLAICSYSIVFRILKPALFGMRDIPMSKHFLVSHSKISKNAVFEAEVLPTRPKSSRGSRVYESAPHSSSSSKKESRRSSVKYDKDKVQSQGSSSNSLSTSPIIGSKSPVLSSPLYEALQKEKEKAEKEEKEKEEKEKGELLDYSLHESVKRVLCVVAHDFPEISFAPPLLEFGAADLVSRSSMIADFHSFL